MKPYRDDKVMLAVHLSCLRHERGIVAHNGREGVNGQPAFYPHRRRLRRLDGLIDRYQVHLGRLEQSTLERWQSK